MSLERPAAKRLLWAWDAIKGYGAQALGLLATGTSIVWGSREHLWDGWGIGWASATVVLLIASFVVQICMRDTSYMALVRENAKMRATSDSRARALEQTIESLLEQLSEYASVGGSDMRASVYYHRDQHFVMIARWSSNPTLRSPGRKTYPDSQGVIGEVWANGSAVATLAKTEERWNEQAEKKGFTPEEIANLTMRPRQIAGLRISHGREPVGVLIVESNAANTLTQSTLDTFGVSMMFPVFSELIGVAAEMTPRGEKETQPITEKRQRQWRDNPEAGR